MADISSLSTVEGSEEGVWLDIYNLDDEPVHFDGKQIRIKLLGNESDALKKIQRRESVHHLKRMRQNKSFDENEIERSERMQLERAVAATVDWENVPVDGKKAECTAANARKVYSQLNVLLARVVEFIDDESNFTMGSSNS